MNSDLPPDLRPLFNLVRSLVPGCALTVKPRYFAEVSREGLALAGQCDNAAALFKHLAGDSEAGWRTMNLAADAWDYGSHWFLVHAPTGLIVDPTADQFPRTVRIPYELARGRTSGGVRYVVGPDGSRVRLPGRRAVRDLLEALPARELSRLAAAGRRAARWATTHSTR